MKKEKGQIFVLMVSVVDSEINFQVSYKELLNSGNYDDNDWAANLGLNSDIQISIMHLFIY